MDPPEFLRISAGTAIWGKEAALKKFENLYPGTWHLKPEMQGFKVANKDANILQIFVPIVFTIGGPGQEPGRTRFLMNMILVREPGKLSVASILRIPSAIQAATGGSAMQ